MSERSRKNVKKKKNVCRFQYSCFKSVIKILVLKLSVMMNIVLRCVWSAGDVNKTKHLS